ncbi:MAG: T9SS type A sorting domain-containing protein [Chitinophagales bacterium]
MKSKFILLIFAYILIGISPFNITLFAQEDCESQYLVTVISQNATCYGGSNGKATIASTGCECMFSGCQFSWSTGSNLHTVDNLPAGTYTATVIHPDGCTISREVVIAEPESFIEDISITPETCGEGGSAKIVPKPLVGELSYEWSNGSTEATLENVAAGIYSVSVTNFMDCTITDTIEITAEAALDATVAEIQPSCPEEASGEVVFEVMSGTPPYIITWQDGSQSNTLEKQFLLPDTYEVQIADANGCMANVSFVVPAVEIEAQASCNKIQICKGEFSIFSATGGIAYEWLPTTGLNNPSSANPLASPEETTTYTVKIYGSKGCFVTKEITIEVLPEPNLFINIGNNTICQGESIVAYATSSGQGNAFSWSPAEGVSNPNSNAVYLSPETTTTYTVTVLNSQGCEKSETITLAVDNCTGIDEVTNDVTANIAMLQDNLQVQFQNFVLSSPYTFAIYNVQGQKFKTGIVETNVLNISLSNMPSGLYLLQLQNPENKQQFVWKWVK